MPQVWLTYEELGNLLKCQSSEARRAVIEHEWPRRRSGDGVTRVKLSPALAHEFMLNYAATRRGELSTDEMVDRLRGLLRDTHGTADMETRSRS
jgi:hypothetical protein